MANVYESVLSSGGPTPTIITPSNPNPVALAANGVYQPTAAGLAIESVGSVTPSDSTPVELTAGGIYTPSAGGFLYESNNLKKIIIGHTDITGGSGTYLNTGLTDINVLLLHGYSNGAYGKNMQFFLRYEKTDPNNFYWLSRYSNNGESGYGPFTNTQLARGYVISNVNGGYVQILSPTTAAWQNTHFDVFAW